MGILFLTALAVFSHLTMARTLDEAQVASLIEEHSFRETFSGNILVSRGDEIVLNQSQGSASLRFGVPLNHETKFLIASLSKQFTAAAIYQLVAQEKLALTDRVASFFEGIDVNERDQARWQNITIRDLLRHQSGLLKNVQINDEFSTSDRHRLSEVAEHILTYPVLFSRDYGEFSYSNIGFILLARVVEIVTKFNFEDYLFYRIFLPLGMENTGNYHRSAILENMAEGYTRDEEGEFSRHCCTDSSNFVGSHSLYSTVGDLHKWMREITTYNQVVPRNFIDDVLAEGEGYANGLYLENRSGQRVIWHDGYELGYNSIMSYSLDSGTGIVILNNLVNVITTPVTLSRVEASLFEVVHSVTTPELR